MSNHTAAAEPSINIGLSLLPLDVWNDYIIRYLDRSDWNQLQLTCKDFVRLSKSNDVTNIPWPTTRCFGSSGSHISSFTISHDGEYLAYSTVIGNVDVWSRRKGKLSAPLLRTNNNHPGIVKTLSTRAYQSRRQQTPVGNVLTFSHTNYVLACGHENRILLWDISTPYDASSCNTVLSICCHPGSCCYEVTYVSFSKDGSKILARHGKTAYVWDLTISDNNNYYHRMTHQIPLSSSRCQMATSSCMNYFAAVSHCSDETGTIDVWNLEKKKKSNIDANMLVPIEGDDAAGNRNWIAQSTRIEAHDKQKIRGLDFVNTTTYDVDLTPTGVTQHWMVSCSLQGEVKLFKQHVNSNSDELVYSCTYTLQCPGKIFSMAILPSSSLSTTSSSQLCTTSSDTTSTTYLAVGQSRGQVRVWKVNLLTMNATDDDSDGSNRNNQQLERRIIDRASQSITARDTNNENNNKNTSNNDILQDFLSTSVGEHMHHDNIKFLLFTPDARHLVASRAYDGRIWFQTCRHS
jgi:hypothetical protein